MKSASRIISLAILAAFANTQSTAAVTGNPADPGTTTVFYTTCPSVMETTVTLSSTLTYCPGDNCGGGPVITPAPGPGAPGVLVPGLGTEIIDYTSTGADGSTTVYHEYETVYHQPCSKCSGGLNPQTFTVTEECPCMSEHASTYIPPGFSTMAYACDDCGENGDPTTVTLTTPCSTGPYANQATASGASTGVWGSNGNNAAGLNATSSGGAGTGATAGYIPGNVGSTANNDVVASVPTSGPDSNSTVNPSITPVAPGDTAGSGTEFRSVASQLVMTGSMAFAVVVGVAAWLL